MPLPSLDKIVPYFQPIILADDQSIYAYEVLGREIVDGEAQSLGPFFASPEVQDEDKLYIDSVIREKAFEMFSKMPIGPKLFINLKPSWAYNFFANQSYLPTRESFDKYSINPSDIVIEITEEELLGDFEEFSHIIAKYHSAGCLVAIDDFGRGASSFERIAYVNPDIIKLDRSIVERMGAYHRYFEISRSMNIFGAQSGFNILFEGIETISQLEACVAASGRLYQGYMFARPAPKMVSEYANKDLFRDIIGVTKSNRFAVAPLRRRTIGHMDAIIKRYKHLIPTNADDLSADNSLFEIAKHLPYFCIQCWVHDKSGVVVSSSCRLGLNNAVVRSEMKGRDLFFKAFFKDAYDSLHSGHSSFLSREYKSVVLKEDVVTYIHPLENDFFFSVNIMASHFL